jgi:hypothetical protein
MDLTNRRRGLIVTAAIACAAMMLPAMALAAPAASSAPRSQAKNGSVPQCRASSIEVWLGLNPDGAAAGTTFYPLEFTNNRVGAHTCWMAGSPGVFAINGAGKRVGTILRPTTSGPKFILKKGQTVFSRLGIVQAGFIAGCHQTTGAGLEVTPPGQSAHQPIFSFTFPACKNKLFLHDSRLLAGVGIP